MTTKFENGLFIFRRDLRIIDNNGLNLLNEKCQNIFTIFIFTPEQVGSANKYKSDNSVQFMIESLQDLSSQISKAGGHLYTFYGHNDAVIADCIKAFNINIVFFNLDITPYARERDDKIIKLCEHMKTYIMYDFDYYLCNPGEVVNGTGETYKKFLHVHHVNGVRMDCRVENLKCLCISCHSEQPMHEHMKNTSEYIEFKNIFS